MAVVNALDISINLLKGTQLIEFTPLVFHI